MDWEVYDLEFLQVQAELLEFLSNKKQWLTVRQIKKGFGERFLADALQVLYLTGKVDVKGSVMRPLYRVSNHAEKAEKKKNCYHCGNRRNESEYVDEDTGEPTKICANCRTNRRNNMEKLQVR